MRRPGQVVQAAAGQPGVAVPADSANLTGGEDSKARRGTARERARASQRAPSPEERGQERAPAAAASPGPAAALSPTVTFSRRNFSSTRRMSRDTSPHLPTCSAAGGLLRGAGRREAGVCA